jgi:hypothetical protein
MKLERTFGMRKGIFFLSKSSQKVIDGEIAAFWSYKTIS